MKIKFILLVYSLSISMVTIIFGSTPFNRPSSLLNIPTARALQATYLNTSLSFGTMREGGEEYDISAYYAINRNIQAGLTLQNSKHTLVHLHANPIEIMIGDLEFRVGGGLLNLGQKQNAVTQNVIEVSNYIVSSFYIKKRLGVHFGIGQRLNKEYSSNMDYNLSGTQPFVGLEWQHDWGKLMFEMDGVDLNMGANYLLGKNTEFKLGLNRLTSDSRVGRQITLAIQFKRSIFADSEKKMKSMQEKMRELRKSRKEIEDTYLEVLSKLSNLNLSSPGDPEDKELLKLMQNVSGYLKIEKPEKAISLMKSAQQFYPKNLKLKMALASLYYGYGKIDEFKQTIEVITEQDPFFPELWNMNESAFNYIRPIVLRGLKKDIKHEMEVTNAIAAYIKELKKRASEYEGYEDFETVVDTKLTIIKLDPFDYEEYISLSDIYTAFSDYKQAKGIVKAAMETFRENSSIQQEALEKLTEINKAENEEQQEFEEGDYDIEMED